MTASDSGDELWDMNNRLTENQRNAVFAAIAGEHVGNELTIIIADG